MSIVDALLSVGLYIVPFVVVLTVVVFFHEFGHFIVGRLCGIKVDAFSIGFGKELFGFNDRNGTRWRIAALPLGGYVKFHGDANGASMTDSASIESMSQQERAVTFAGQPVWKRALTVLAGPVANFILAIAVLSIIFFCWGRQVLTPRVDGVSAGSAAEAAGFKSGDLVLSVDGTNIKNFSDLQRFVSISPDRQLNIVVDREGKEVTIQATPRLHEVTTPLGKTRTGQLGVETGARPQDWRTEWFSPAESVELAAKETWTITSMTGKYLIGLVSGRESPDQLTGPAGIAQISGEMAKLGLGALLNLLAIISISIGLLNLAPIPLLDGGHLLFYAYEGLRGKALPERAQEFGFRVGIAVVGCLFLIATFNDATRLGPQVLKWIMPG